MAEEQLVFAIGSSSDGVPVLVIGMPKAGWEYIKDGKTNNIDMVKVGIPLRVVVFGGDDHARCLDMIKKLAAFNDMQGPLTQRLDIDFSLPGEEKK